MRMKRIVRNSGFGMFLLLILVIVVFGLFNHEFFKPINIVQYVNNGVVLGFLTLGLSATVISGNYDYSVASMTSFGTVILALLLRNGVPLFLSLL